MLPAEGVRSRLRGATSSHNATTNAFPRISRTGIKEFPPFRLDTANQCLWRSGDHGDEERILLKPKAFAILLYLVDHAGRLVTQQELLEAVWPDTFVQPEVLKRHIFDIRDVLGDDPKKPIYIETLPRRGYQFIAAVRDAASADPAPQIPAQTKLVGRERALGELGVYLGRAFGGQRQIVFVTGEPGIGKTTLVDEFQRQATTGGSIRIARGQCVEGYGSKEAYYPVLEALGNLCRGPEGDSVVQILAAQAPTWLVQFPALLKRQQGETLQREIQGATRQRMLREIGEALETITSEKPLLLVLEDLHWVDPSTVDLISALSRGRGTAKLMVVATYRPVDVALANHPLNAVKQDLLVHQLCHELALEPLGEKDIAAYLAGQSSDASVPKGLAALLHRHSEGNPLFMVAALEHMTQRGLISRENGECKLNLPLEEIDLEVPESLRQLIELQIDRLSTEEQRVLEVASLESVGRSRFAVVPRAAAGDLEPEAFEDVCETLSRRHCILCSARSEQFPDGTVSACYEFVHALYREVCYQRIAPERRVKLHRQLGEWGEANLLERVDEDAAWLAGHFEQGRDWPRAIKYLHLAADSAGRLFGPRQAAGILEHALDLVNRLPDAERAEHEIKILERLGTICNASLDSRAVETPKTVALMGGPLRLS